MLATRMASSPETTIVMDSRLPVAEATQQDRGRHNANKMFPCVVSALCAELQPRVDGLELPT